MPKSSTYRAPGVYIEEVPSGARPIQAAGTRTAGFVGVAPGKELNPKTAVPINSWSEFKRQFAGPTAVEVKALEDAQVNLDARRRQKAAKTEIDAAQKAVEAARTAVNAGHASTDLSHAVYGFFLNGGRRCYVVNIQDNTTIDDGLNELAKIDEIAIIAAPGFTTKAAYIAVRDHCDSLKDRVGILDGPEMLSDDEIRQMSGQTVNGATWEMPSPSENGQLTLYTPWLTVTNPDPDPAGNMPTINVPPSGHVAGVWARTDTARGVHKAPANEVVRGALGLQRQITHAEQGGMNANGVNCIRNFPREGILVWGARTLTNETAFRYLNVRRLLNMIAESIAEGTRWVVFEPNDQPWQAVRRDVSAFLMAYWRDGALIGHTPAEAFFVKCDEETNTLVSINEGKVIVEMGVAPVKPAEYIILRISQHEAGPDVEISGG